MARGVREGVRCHGLVIFGLYGDASSYTPERRKAPKRIQWSRRGRVGNFAERATCEVNLQVRYTGMYSSSSLPRVGVPSFQIGGIIAVISSALRLRLRFFRLEAHETWS